MQKKPNSIDKHVGARIRLRRMMLGLTQEGLGEGLGVTFQQVQKYEKGTNRVGASRLQKIAEVLNAPISFFFEEAPGALHPEVEKQETNSLSNVLASKEFLSLVSSFSAITDPRVRQKVVALVDALAGSEDKDDIHVPADLGVVSERP